LTLSALSIDECSREGVAVVTGRLASGSFTASSSPSLLLLLLLLLHCHPLHSTTHPLSPPPGFAAIYVGCEVVFKLMASLIQQQFGNTSVFIA
jgi:hypothetical protein